MEMIKKLILALIVIVSVSGITSCVSTDDDGYVSETQSKINQNQSNAIIFDTLTPPTNPASLDAPSTDLEDGDREKWGNTKRQ